MSANCQANCTFDTQVSRKSAPKLRMYSASIEMIIGDDRLAEQRAVGPAQRIVGKGFVEEKAVRAETGRKSGHDLGKRAGLEPAQDRNAALRLLQLLSDIGDGLLPGFLSEKTCPSFPEVDRAIAVGIVNRPEARTGPGRRGPRG